VIKIEWVLYHLLPFFGFLLAVTLLVHQRRERRSPASTIAWFLGIVLVPYIGVPAYLLFGGRKIKRMIRSKDSLAPGKNAPPAAVGQNESGGILPLRPGNDYTILGTGEQAYSALIDHIESAGKSIDIATYVFTNDSTGSFILDALTRKAVSGVRVRLLLDAVGSFKISDAILGRFLAAGGKRAVFMPMMHLPFRGRANLRNHRKVAIFDATTAIFGGMNIAREYMGADTDAKRWYDLSIIVRGPVIADLAEIFQSDWQFAAKQDNAIGFEPFSTAPAGASTMQVVPSGPDVDGDPIHDGILSVLFAARERVWIVTPYFIPDEMTLKAICIAARRGVDVRILVPQVSNHLLADIVRRGYLREVQSSGATIHNFTPGMLHGKIILVDSSLVIAGSMNMDMRSFFLNYETAVFMYDEKIVSELEQWIRDRMSQSVTGIDKSNDFAEFLEGAARLLSPLL
jgi:cardiolipin synthase A/B